MLGTKCRDISGSAAFLLFNLTSPATLLKYNIKLLEYSLSTVSTLGYHNGSVALGILLQLICYIPPSTSSIFPVFHHCLKSNKAHISLKRGKKAA